jgi:RNA recognition motif-containing protein
MAEKMEISLDEIIKTEKIGFHRGGAKKQVNGTGGYRRKIDNKPVQKFHGTANRQIGKPQGRSLTKNGAKQGTFKGFKKLFTSGARNGFVNSGSATLLVSNLDRKEVTESDLHELFVAFGPLISASLRYDQYGRSLGMADIIFKRRGDAITALEQYNGRTLDGQPMHIQLINLETPQAVVRNQRPKFNPNRNYQGRQQRKPEAPQERKVGGHRIKPKPVSLEDLDAELDAYISGMHIQQVKSEAPQAVVRNQRPQINPNRNYQGRQQSKPEAPQETVSVENLDAELAAHISGMHIQLENSETKPKPVSFEDLDAELDAELNAELDAELYAELDAELDAYISD